jgi:predicted phage-related endonuclease
MDCAILEVPRHPPSEEKIRERVREFWRNTDAGIEPDPDFSRDAEVIKALVPRETPGKQISFAGDNELPSILAERATLMSEIKEAETRCSEIETTVKFLMGDAEVGNGLDGWRLTYKVEHRNAYTVPAKDPRVLRIKDKRPEAS